MSSTSRPTRRPWTSRIASTRRSVTTASAPRSTVGWCRWSTRSRTARSSRSSPPRDLGPSRDWLNFVKSASAKERIRKWFKSQSREENVAKGHDLLDKELHRMHRVSLADLPEPKLLEIASLQKFATIDHFLAAIGYGDLSPHAVVMRMALSLDTPGADLRTIPSIPQIQPSPRVLVRGEKGILTTI